jgi:ABC-type nitrate/sulfonate/bicarbonate transport system substrate-binding protein
VFARRTFFATIAGAAAAFNAAAAFGETDAPLRVACIATDPFGEALYAKDGRFFQSAGLSVELVLLPSSGPLLLQSRAGRLMLA